MSVIQAALREQPLKHQLRISGILKPLFND
jgi:hypothetical protein